jgi:hypothetical protein
MPGNPIIPQPSINIQGIRVDEPMVALTDLLVSTVCLIAFIKLSKLQLPGRAQLYFRLYLLLMCIATCFGGLIGHAFLYALSFAWKLPGWILSMLSVALIERSSIEHAKPFIQPRVAKVFLIINIIELITIMTVTMVSLNFRWVEFHSGYGLLAVVLPFHTYVYYRTKDKGSLLIMIAVGIASGAALFFMNRISFHTWFNYLDISHVLMAVAVFVFYQGAKRLRRQDSN